MAYDQETAPPKRAASPVVMHERVEDTGPVLVEPLSSWENEVGFLRNKLAHLNATEVRVVSDSINLRGRGSLPNTPNKAEQSASEAAGWSTPTTPTLSAMWRAEASLGATYERGKGRDEAMIQCADELDQRDAAVIVALERLRNKWPDLSETWALDQIQAALARLKGE